MEDLNQIVTIAHSLNSTHNELEPNKEKVTVHTTTVDNNITHHIVPESRLHWNLSLEKCMRQQVRDLWWKRGMPLKHGFNESQLFLVTLPTLVFNVQHYGGDDVVKRRREHHRGYGNVQILASISKFFSICSIGLFGFAWNFFFFHFLFCLAGCCIFKVYHVKLERLCVLL